MAASDQTTLAGLTQLSAPAAADRLLIEDASANETKYIERGDLLGYGNAAISAPRGSATSLGSISDWTTITVFDTNGVGEGSTPDHTTNSIVLLDEAGTYLLLYRASAYSSATCVLESRLTQDGTAIADSYSGQAVETTGANGSVNVGGHSLFVASGGETILAQVRPSTTATVTVDSAHLTAIRVG